MKCGCNYLNTFMLMMFLIVCCVSFETCNGRQGMPYWRKLKAASSSSSSSASASATFNVLDYGAKGDGKADDTKGFEDTWAAACKVEASTMIVPSDYVFLVKPISFAGPNCEPNIVFQLDGKIIAPTSSSAWGSGTSQWLEFTKLNKITITGKGVIDGQGSVWWKDNSGMPTTKPTALRFYGSDVVTVKGITIQNSQQFHLKFDSCTNVEVSDITISSPADSPNTDGIHLQNSNNVLIYRSNLACGDDCVSIQTGCSNINVHDIKCGPGHGISIGSLGKDKSKACVSNVTVRDITLQDTLSGVRIKTWQGGSGSVKAVMFSDIEVSGVQTPILIDQYYCDQSKCKNQSSAVAVSDIHYTNVKGTYTKEAVRLACSDSVPCTHITLDTIQLQQASDSKSTTSNADEPFCWEAYGEVKTETHPPIHCLHSGKPSNAALDSNQDSC